MILMVAQQLSYPPELLESPLYESFCHLVSEITMEMLISQPLTKRTTGAFTIALIALAKFCSPRSDFSEVWQALDTTILNSGEFQSELSRNKKSLASVAHFYSEADEAANQDVAHMLQTMLFDQMEGQQTEFRSKDAKLAFDLLSHYTRIDVTARDMFQLACSWIEQEAHLFSAKDKTKLLKRCESLI